MASTAATEITTAIRSRTLKGHPGADLHIYFRSILKVYTIRYFSIAKLFLISLLRNNYLSPKCIRSWNLQFLRDFPRSISLVEWTDTILNVVTNCCIYTYRSESVGKRKKTFPRRIMIRLSARCTTNMRRQVNNVNRRSRHLADGRTYRQSSEFPGVRIKLQISGPLR